jgi:hypothetical protein
MQRGRDAAWGLPPGLRAPRDAAAAQRLPLRTEGSSTIRIKIIDSDIGYFAILQQMSGFADQIFGYFAILQQMSGFVDRIF